MKKNKIDKNIKKSFIKVNIKNMNKKLKICRTNSSIIRTYLINSRKN